MIKPLLQDYSQQGEDLRALIGQIQQHATVHAYLLSGEKGLGKRTFAGLMGQALLCQDPHFRPCGHCRNCTLASAGEHPDLAVIAKGAPLAPGIPKDRTTIPVDDIREMIRFCSVRSSDGNMRIVLIFDVDRMTVQAQNCLLKTLEDPPEDICIVLVTEHTEALLPTVLSRCRIIRFKPWDDAVILRILKEQGIGQERAEEVLAAADGSIGKALELASDEAYWKLKKEVKDNFFYTFRRSDILRISNGWKNRKGEAEQILSMLEADVRVLLTSRNAEADNPGLNAFPPPWQRFSREAEPERFLMLMDAVAQARKQLLYSANFQTVIEKLLFLFMGEGNQWSE